MNKDIECPVCGNPLLIIFHGKLEMISSVNLYSETMNFPVALQELIMSRRDDFIMKHPDVMPNLVVIQNDVLCGYQFPKDIIWMNPKDRPEWFDEEFMKFMKKLKKWEGQLLFEWRGMKIYNRWHVIGNRDNPFIFLEV